MIRYKESGTVFKKGDKVKVLKGRYKNFIGIVIEDEDDFMPNWIRVDFPDKAKLGINTGTDMMTKEVILVKKG